MFTTESSAHRRAIAAADVEAQHNTNHVRQHICLSPWLKLVADGITIACEAKAKSVYNKSLSELDRINVAVHLGFSRKVNTARMRMKDPMMTILHIKQYRQDHRSVRRY